DLSRPEEADPPADVGALAEALHEALEREARGEPVRAEDLLPAGSERRAWLADALRVADRLPEVRRPPPGGCRVHPGPLPGALDPGLRGRAGGAAPAVPGRVRRPRPAGGGQLRPGVAGRRPAPRRAGRAEGRPTARKCRAAVAGAGAAREPGAEAGPAQTPQRG